MTPDAKRGMDNIKTGNENKKTCQGARFYSRVLNWMPKDFRVNQLLYIYK
jgi:hypothetical protein